MAVGDVNLNIKNEWTMQQDWALVDQLPKFTVIGDGRQHTRTFWAQLAASTPELSYKHPDELMQRCDHLNNAIINSHTSPSVAVNTSSDILLSQRRQDKEPKETLLVYGPSPPILENWQVFAQKPGGSNQVVGQTENGRTVWLQYHCMGRLERDPNVDNRSSPSILSLAAGGYLEAVGGRIYELGQSRQQHLSSPSKGNSETQAHSSIPSSFLAGGRERFSLAGGNAHFNTLFVTNDEDQKIPFAEWWGGVPSTAMSITMSALLASAVLSACVGYGAGLGILTDANRQFSSSPLQSTGAVAVTTAPTMSDRPNVGASSSSISEPTLRERRARAEYRTLKEQRLLRIISERLEKDEIELNNLRREELLQIGK